LRGGQPGGRRWRRALSEMPDGRSGLARLRALLEQLAVAAEVGGAAYVTG
jgi:hypothetical protein